MKTAIRHSAQRTRRQGGFVVLVEGYFDWAQAYQAGITNVEVRETDGAKGLPAEAPFDVIVLSGSVAEVPQALLSQLKVGGRLAAIVQTGSLQHH